MRRWGHRFDGGIVLPLDHGRPAEAVKVRYNFNGSVGRGTYAPPERVDELMKSGSSFPAYLSSDEVNWTSVLSKALTTADPVTTGVFACPHIASVLGTATFNNVSYTSGPEPIDRR